jgi:hypothetical protein
MSRYVLDSKSKGEEPLQGAGLAYLAGMTLKFDGRSPSGSYSPQQTGVERRRVDPKSARAVLVWASGVLAVKFGKGLTVPKFVLAELDRRHRGWYTLRVYTSLKVIRYLVSCDVRRLASFQNIWLCNFKLLCQHPSEEFLNLIGRLPNTCERPRAASSVRPRREKKTGFPVEPVFSYLRPIIDYDPDLIRAIEEDAVLTEAEFLAEQEAFGSGDTDSEEEEAPEDD